MTSTIPDHDPDPDPDEGEADDVEPVEVLVGLAEDGEIEPWDIDIVEVTDAFLARLDETDLRTSGRALFYASVLLRMKSDAVVGADEPAEEPEPEPGPPPWEAAMEGAAGPGAAPADGGGDPVDALEAEMERRLDRKTARGTPETLDELVRELREAERDSWWKSSRSYDTSDSPSGFSRGVQTVDYHADDAGRAASEPTEAEVTGTTHGEDIEAATAAVADALATSHERGREEVLFAEIDDAAGSRVQSYLGVLFLAHRGDAVLEQDELFGDLWLRATPD